MLDEGYHGENGAKSDGDISEKSDNGDGNDRGGLQNNAIAGILSYIFDEEEWNGNDYPIFGDVFPREPSLTKFRNRSLLLGQYLQPYEE